MHRSLAVLVTCSAIAVACGGSPTAPTEAAARVSRALRLTRTRFMAFGDSFTAGEVTAPVASNTAGKLVVVPSAAYPGVLLSQLQSSYPSQSSVITMSNQGRPGETIFDGVLRFDGVFDAVRPEVVLIQEGLNGLSFTGADGSTSLMRQMVQRAKNGNARVLVGSMLPSIANRLRSQNPLILMSYNEALRAMCALEGVTYVDLYGGMLPEAEQLIGIDGLHPTETGYRRIADLFFAAIRSEIEER